MPDEACEPFLPASVEEFRRCLFDMQVVIGLKLRPRRNTLRAELHPAPQLMVPIDTDESAIHVLSHLAQLIAICPDLCDELERFVIGRQKIDGDQVPRPGLRILLPPELSGERLLGSKRATAHAVRHR